MDIGVWRRSFTADDIPRYPCPKCREKSLKLNGEVEVREPTFSTAYANHDDWEPALALERFLLRLICDVPKCGEVVYVIGFAGWDYDYGAEDGTSMVRFLRPKAFYPAPPMIDFPKEIPKRPEAEITKSFAVCWVDPNSAANRLRVGVELILDNLKVPKVIKTKKGGKHELDLNGRIQWLEKQTAQEASHAGTFHALRVAGNVGSHGAGVSWESFLDCLLLLEAAVEEIFGKSSQMLLEAKERLMKLKEKSKN